MLFIDQVHIIHTAGYLGVRLLRTVMLIRDA